MISAYGTKVNLTAAFDALYFLVCRVKLDGGLHGGTGNNTWASCHCKSNDEKRMALLEKTIG
jgi:hypothetical protein